MNEELINLFDPLSTEPEKKNIIISDENINLLESLSTKPEKLENLKKLFNRISNHRILLNSTNKQKISNLNKLLENTKKKINNLEELNRQKVIQTELNKQYATFNFTGQSLTSNNLPFAPTTSIFPSVPTHNIRITSKKQTIGNMVEQSQKVLHQQTPLERALAKARKANENERILQSKTKCKNKKCTISGGKK